MPAKSGDVNCRRAINRKRSTNENCRHRPGFLRGCSAGLGDGDAIQLEYGAGWRALFDDAVALGRSGPGAVHRRSKPGLSVVEKVCLACVWPGRAVAGIGPGDAHWDEGQWSQAVVQPRPRAVSTV